MTPLLLVAHGDTARSIGDDVIRNDMRAALAALHADSSQLFGIGSADLRVIGTMSRPFSELTRVEVTTATGKRTLFVKVVRPPQLGLSERDRAAQRVLNDFHITRRLHETMAVAEGLAVVKPVICYPEHLAIVTEEAAGDTLMNLLNARGRWWPAPADQARLQRVFEQLGRWLRNFQRLQIDQTDDRVTVPRLREYIDIRLARLAANPHSGYTAADRQAVLRALDARLSAVTADEGAPVAIHGDVALGNVLADNDTIVVLDLVMTTKGTKYHDLAHVDMQLELLRFKPQFRPGLIRRLQRALVAGYSSAPVVRTPLFEALQVLHVANHYLGLVERPARTLERLYNARIARRHLAWLRRLATTPVQGA